MYDGAMMNARKTGSHEALLPVLGEELTARLLNEVMPRVRAEALAKAKAKGLL